MSKTTASHYVETGCRVPKDYFWVIGRGRKRVWIRIGFLGCCVEPVNRNAHLKNL
jgi:hypothetical protein